MDTLEKIARLEQRIEALVAGKEIDAKHINVLLFSRSADAALGRHRIQTPV